MADTSTNVIIKNKITDDPFKSIIAAIQKSQSSTNSTLDRLGDQQQRQHNSDIIESTAQKRRDRATAAALLGTVHKTTSAVEALKDLLKDVLSKLTSIIIDGFKRTVDGYDSTALEMQRANVDHTTKIVALQLASQAKTNGLFRTNLSSLQSVTSEWAMKDRSGFESFTRMYSEEQKPFFINLMGEMREQGYSFEEIMAVVRNIPKDFDFNNKENKKLLYTLTQQKSFGAGEAVKVFTELKTSNDAFIIDKLGGPVKALEKLTNNAQRLTALNIVGENGEQIIEKFTKFGAQLDAGAFESIDTKDLSTFLGLGVKNITSSDELLSGLESKIKEIDKLAAGNEEEKALAKAMSVELNKQLRVFKGEYFDEETLGKIGNQISIHAAGNADISSVPTYEQSVDADKDNTPDGKIKSGIEWLTAGFDNITGGFLSKLSVNATEIFGEEVGSFDILKITTQGFVHVIDLLRKIHFHLILNSILNFLKGIFPKLLIFLRGILPKITGLFRGLFSKAAGLFRGLFSKAAGLFRGLPSKIGNLFRGLPSKIGNLFRGLFSRGGGLLSRFAPRLLPLLGRVAPMLLRVAGPIGWAVTALQAGGKLGSFLAKKIFPDAYALLEKAGGYWGSIKEIASFIGDSVSELWEYDIKPMLSNVGSFFTESIPNFFTETIPNFFTDSIPNLFKNAINSLKTSVKDFFSPMREFFNFDWLPEPVKNVLFGLNEAKDFVINGAKDVGGSIKDGIVSFFSSLLHADGIVANTPTPSIIGEAGKEILLPLTRPDRMRELLSSLTNAEKSSIISAINSSSQANNSNNTDLNVQSNSTVPGNDAATINKILSYSSNPAYVYDSIRYGRKKDGSLKSKDPEYGAKKREVWYKESLQNAQNREGYDLIKGTWAERALAWGASQIGLPYLLRSIGKIGYVCNELTNAALKGSGFDLKDFRIHGVKTTFANISSGKMISGKDRKGRMREYPSFRLRPDITPETAVPGMIFFQDSSKNKDGQFAPGHVGLVYYGHQRLHSAGGSGDYSGPDAFLNKYQTPCRGVTVNEFDKNARYQFGELPGLFEQASGEWEPPKNAPVEFGPTDINKKPGEAILDEQNNLAESAKSSVTENTSKYQAADMQKYIKLVTGMIGTNNTKEILSFMEVMIKYLRDIANAPANKRPNMSPARPVPNVY